MTFGAEMYVLHLLGRFSVEITFKTTNYDYYLLEQFQFKINFIAKFLIKCRLV